MVGYLKLFNENGNKYEELYIPNSDFNLTFLVPKSTVSIKSIVEYNNGMITTITEYKGGTGEEEYTDLYEILKELNLSKNIIKNLKEVRLCQDRKM